MKLDFLLSTDLSNYSLTEKVSELTNLQILFLVACAELRHEAMEEEQNKKPTNPLEITADDSIDVINHKLKLMGALNG